MKQNLDSWEKLLENKVAIITGAAKGIGRGVALEFAKHGASIVIADIDNKESKITESALKDLGSGVLNLNVDISDYDQNNRMVNKVLEKFGRIDILVNNAGIGAVVLRDGLLKTNKKDALNSFNTNLIGPFFLTQRVIKEMISGKIKGNILFTSSTHSHIIRLDPVYSSTKAAIEMLVKDIAIEVADFGIRVNAVSPGAIAVRDEKDRSTEHVPLGYRGTPRDIANAMVFLASEKAGYITGQTLIVDGAFSLAHTHYWIKKGKL